jgi:hypothetical protein
VPRARLNTSDGKTTEWKSRSLRNYQRRTLAADALIAGTYLSGTNTRRVRRALSALFGGAVGKDAVSRVWRKVSTQQASLPSRTDLMSPVGIPSLPSGQRAGRNAQRPRDLPHHRRRVGRSRGSPAWGPFGPAPAFTRVVTVPGRKGRRNRNHHDHGAEKQILHDALPLSSVFSFHEIVRVEPHFGPSTHDNSKVVWWQNGGRHGIAIFNRTTISDRIP